jgi:GNAT superfamily N-acetyltransferase
MDNDDKDFFMYLMEKVNWGMTSIDFNRLLKFSPSGCFIAEKEGENVGMVTTTNYGKIGWIGNLIVIPELRGNGIGSNLMKHAIEYLVSKEASSIKLDSVPQAVSLYSRLGFKEEYLSLRYTCHVTKKTDLTNSLMLRKDFEQVASLDKKIFKVNRRHILEYFFELYPELCFTTWHKSNLVGYIMAKQTKNLVKIGPWIVLSRHKKKAEKLLLSLLSNCLGRKVWVGVPERNKNCVKILQKNGFKSHPSSVRMCYGTCNLGETIESVYGIGGPDKG